MFRLIVFFIFTGEKSESQASAAYEEVAASTSNSGGAHGFVDASRAPERVMDAS